MHASPTLPASADHARHCPPQRASGALAALCGVAALGFGACAGDVAPPAAPSLPPAPAPAPEFRLASFLVDVSPSKGTITVVSPAGTLTAALGAEPPRGGNSSLEPEARGPTLSLVGGDVIELLTSDPVFTRAGAGDPRARITFNVRVRNRLGGAELVTPTFPVPPADAPGVVLFPFSAQATASGGSVAADGNVIVVGPPRSGTVRPDTNFVFPAHNFFNDAGCPAGSNDCFPYEVFGTVGPRDTSETRTVGFEFDPGVGDFRVRMVVAADLAAVGSPPPPPTTCSPNAAPSLRLVGVYSRLAVERFARGIPVAEMLRFHFSDADCGPWQARIAWGDGTVNTFPISESLGPGLYNTFHRYASAGRFTVAMTVTDAGGLASVERSIPVDVVVP